MKLMREDSQLFQILRAGKIVGVVFFQVLVIAGFDNQRIILEALVFSCPRVGPSWQRVEPRRRELFLERHRRSAGGEKRLEFRIRRRRSQR